MARAFRKDVPFLANRFTGRSHLLWQSVSAEERARFALLSPARSQLLGRLFVGLWILRAVAASSADFLAHRGIGLPATTFFRSPFAAALEQFFFTTLLIYPLLWSWRVLRQPAGVCSGALRRLALWTFPLSVAALALCTLLLLWAIHLPATVA